jgi:hypothetical protein
MSEQRRPPGVWGDDLDRELLGSARDDAPAPQARPKLLLSLGVAGATSATSAAAVASASGKAAAAGSVTAGALQGGGVLVSLKWVAVGVVAVGVAVGAGEVARRVGREPPALPPTPSVAPRSTGGALPTTAGPPAASAQYPRAVAPSPMPPLTSTSPVRRKAPSFTAPAAAPSPSAASGQTAPALAHGTTPTPEAAPPAAASSTASSLVAETAAIDAARAALRDRRPTEAIAQLDAYAARFPHGTFEPESVALRIEALRTSDPDTAEHLGRAFLAAHPDGPLSDRVRELLNR